MAKRELNVKVNTDVSGLTNSIEKVTKEIERLRKSLEHLNSTGLNIEIEQQPEITVGVDLSSQKDFYMETFVEAIVRETSRDKKYYIVKDRYTNKPVAYFLDKETAKLLEIQSRYLSIEEHRA